MILTGCLGLGLWYRRQFRLRVVWLRRLSEILEMLMSEVRYGSSTLPECCGQAGRQTGGELGEVLAEVADIMRANTGESFGVIFCGRMEEAMKRLPLKREDRERFLKFARTDSFAEGAMQLRWMEQSREQLMRTAEALEERTQEQSRLAVGLGVMSGLLLIIILI